MAYGYSSLAGKFVIWGGLQLPTNYKNVGSIWNGSSWTTLPTPPTPLNPRSLMAFGVEGDYFVVWGGTDGATQYNDGMYYKFSMNQSYDMAPSPLSPRFNASSTMVNGKLLVWGGQDVVGNRFSDGALFDPVTNTWTTLSPSFPPPPLSEAMVTTDGQRIYFRGGRFDNVNNSSQTFMYDLATNQWDALPFTNLPAGLTNGVFMNIGSQLLMIGGSDTFDFPTTNVRLLKPAP
ncbi:MAG: kelch repeat-containing protein [Bacteriovoracia bacterium]